MNSNNRKSEWTGFLTVFFGVPIISFLVIYFAKAVLNLEIQPMFGVIAIVSWVIASYETYPNDKTDDCDCNDAEFSVVYFASNLMVVGGKKMKSSAYIPELPKAGDQIALTDADRDTDKYVNATVTGVHLASNQTSDGSDYIITVDVGGVEKLRELNWEDVEE